MGGTSDVWSSESLQIEKLGVASQKPCTPLPCLILETNSPFPIRWSLCCRFQCGLGPRLKGSFWLYGFYMTGTPKQGYPEVVGSNSALVIRYPCSTPNHLKFNPFSITYNIVKYWLFIHKYLRQFRYSYWWRARHVGMYIYDR